jgi:hypothetical protein
VQRTRLVIELLEVLTSHAATVHAVSVTLTATFVTARSWILAAISGFYSL